MTFPLMVLALLSIVGGFIPFSEFVTADKAAFEAHLNYPLAAIAVGVGLTGIILAAILACLIGALVPSWQAAKLQPVKTLQVDQL